MKLTNNEVIILKAMFSQLERHGVRFDSEESRLIEKVKIYSIK